jgi:hypothetical protein
MIHKKKRIKVWCEDESWVDSKKKTRCSKCNRLLQPRTIDHNPWGDREFIGFRIPIHKKLVKEK